MLPEYLAGLRRDTAAAEEALARGDWEKVRDLAHVFKGLGGSFGCDEVTRLGGLLEAAAKAGRADPARGLMGELADYVSRIELAPEP
ncbi:MAG: hypothetical protein A2506_01650 [Elusimicrobia bacterium RIFOXYD12_FULL_66_9]|nr:MAG: hypothetical protein A2506_01650 [Elusimicrobia bacterium RIFOXYD12_FULL_66_9]